MALKWNAKRETQNGGKTLEEMIVYCLQYISVPPHTYIPPTQNDTLLSKYAMIFQTWVYFSLFLKFCSSLDH